MKSIITANNISFELPDGRLLFTHLNLSIENKLTALVGPNGVGKTCLARILAGELMPSSGSIQRGTQILLMHQRELPPQQSVAQYLSKKYVWSVLGEQLLNNIDRQAQCHQLSGGQWMRVRLARALEDSFLILDEPTNDLDREGREALLNFLKKRKSGALLISHDRECLQLCEEVMELSNQGLSKFGGTWDEYKISRDDERNRLEVQLDSAKQSREVASKNRQEQIDKQEKRNRQGAKTAARGGLPKILMGARKRLAQSTTGKLDADTMEKTNQSVYEAHEAYKKLKIDPIMFADLMGQPIPSQKLVVEAKDFNIRFSSWIYKKDLNFIWRGNLRLAIKGKNGSGKSSLLKAFTTNLINIRGEIRKGDLKTLFIDQACSSLDDSKSVLENVQAFCIGDEGELRNKLAKFLFMKDSVFQKINTLSGGERLRAALAQGFLSEKKPELVILDEPTNNLDLMNIEFLEQLLRDFKGALLVISHDEVFLQNANITDELILE